MLFEVRRAAAAVAARAARRAGLRESSPEPARHPLQVVDPADVRAGASRRPRHRAGAEMKLEGSLDAFSLPDIFQLLSFTKKTGGLHLAHDGSDGVVYFAGGQITGASADELAAAAGPPAGRQRHRSTDEALDRARSRPRPTARALGVVRALLEQGAVDADLLRRAATDQAVDAVFDLLRWRDGDFAFVDGRGQPRRRRRRAGRRGGPRRHRGPPRDLGDRVAGRAVAARRARDAGRAAGRPAGQPRGVGAAGAGRRPAHASPSWST